MFNGTQVSQKLTIRPHLGVPIQLLLDERVDDIQGRIYDELKPVLQVQSIVSWIRRQEQRVVPTPHHGDALDRHNTTQRNVSNEYKVVEREGQRWS